MSVIEETVGKIVGDSRTFEVERVFRKRRVQKSTVICEGAEEIGKVLFGHESRILTPGGGTISPGGAGPPASPSSGHYHPSTHSPPLVKVSVCYFGFYCIFYSGL